MNFCEHCGAKMSPDFKFCMQCGRPVGAVQAAPQPPAPAPVGWPTVPQAPGIPPEARAAADIQRRHNNRVWAVISILFFLILLFVLLMQFSPEVEAILQGELLMLLAVAVISYLVIFIGTFYWIKHSAIRKAGIDPRRYTELVQAYRWMEKQQKAVKAQPNMPAPATAQPAAGTGAAKAGSSSSWGLILILLLCAGMVYYAVNHLNELNGGGNGGGSRTLSGEWVDSAGGSSYLNPGGKTMRYPADTIVFKSNGTCFFSQVGVEYDSSRPVNYKISGSKITFSGYGKNTTGTISGSTITAFGKKYVPRN